MSTKKQNRRGATRRAVRRNNGKNGKPFSDAKRDGMCAASRGYGLGIGR